MLSPSRKVLVYLFGSLGDTIMAIPALRAVQRHFYDAELVLLQNVPANEIVKASEVIPSDLIARYVGYDGQASGLAKVHSFYRLWRELRNERVASVVYLVISERPRGSVLRDKLFFRLCGIRNLIGFHAFSEHELYPVDDAGQPAVTENEAVRKLERLKLDGIEILRDDDLRQPFFTFSAADLDPIKRWLAERRKNPASRLIAMAPGCKTKANAWQLDNFVEIGKRLIARGNVEILIIGGKAEFELGKKMTAVWKTGINASGSFSVKDSGALLSLCDAYVGLDTGTTHLAAAVGTRCFSIYGQRNNPGHWSPIGNQHVVVSHPVKCAGCRTFECPLPDHPCMTGISIEAVWQDLQKFLALSN